MNKATGLPNAIDLFTSSFISYGLKLDDDEIGNKIMSDVNQESLDKIIAECKQFQTDSDGLLDYSDKQLIEQAGLDFYLTRNGHGTGFWDREDVYGEDEAKELTEIAEKFGSCGFYRNSGQRWVGWERQ